MGKGVKIGESFKETIGQHCHVSLRGHGDKHRTEYRNSVVRKLKEREIVLK